MLEALLMGGPLLRECVGGLYVEEFAYLLTYIEIEINEICPPFLKKRTDIIGIILKEGREIVGTLKRIPMHMSPVAMVADTYVTHYLLSAMVSLHWHCEGLGGISSGYDAPVAVGLLIIGVA